MNLSYTLPKAEEKILAGIKKHTFREDRKNKWGAGMLIHHCYSFRSERGYRCFLLNKCVSIQHILMVLLQSENVEILKIVIDRQMLPAERHWDLILNDGFTRYEDFLQWFFPFDKKGERQRTMWAGKIIHFTDLKY